MRTFTKYAGAVALAGALASAAATPSEARWHGHRGGGAAVAGFAAGALIGAAVANAYAPAPGYYDDSYAYAPGPYADDGYDSYAYAPGPAYYGPAPRYGRLRNDGNCTASPASVNFNGCANDR